MAGIVSVLSNTKSIVQSTTDGTHAVLYIAMKGFVCAKVSNVPTPLLNHMYLTRSHITF